MQRAWCVTCRQLPGCSLFDQVCPSHRCRATACRPQVHACSHQLHGIPSVQPRTARYCLHAAAAGAHLAVVGQRLRHRQRGGACEHAHLQHRLGARQPAQGGDEAALQRASAALRLLQELRLALQQLPGGSASLGDECELLVRGLYRLLRTICAQWLHAVETCCNGFLSLLAHLLVGVSPIMR